MSFSESALIKVTFNGGTDVNAVVSVPGLKIGDIVLAIHSGAGTWNTEFFYPLVTADDSLTQAASSDVTATTFTAVVARLP